MRVSAIHQIKPIPPLFPTVPPPPKKDKPEEPLSFCGRLNRLLEVHRRHLMFERMMNFWMRMMSHPVQNSGRLNLVA